MADFAGYFPTLLRNEGGYCHYPTDPGGETYRGIARVYHPTWPGWAVVDAVKAERGLPNPVPTTDWSPLSTVLIDDPALGPYVLSFYQALYWNSLELSQVHSQALANQMADHAVNAGTIRPVKMIQYLLSTYFGAHLTVDGEMGPATLAALNQANAQQLYEYFIEMRRAFYYYRADYPVTSTPHMASWAEFLSTGLDVRPDAVMHQYLNSWLSRTNEPFA